MSAYFNMQVQQVCKPKSVCSNLPAVTVNKRADLILFRYGIYYLEGLEPGILLDKGAFHNLLFLTGIP
ncbi:hypothetical protein XELAEV_18012980mg [Xenopus laevis]|uniref:Uncharacterized protein n=1 Tax=Xenopus laevis TaxID=8355 RepID=A0A974DNQ2_XENLA|nr:hypothetical protein XELAEV_18012980mg [Xenopus laevis]